MGCIGWAARGESSYSASGVYESGIQWLVMLTISTNRMQKVLKASAAPESRLQMKFRLGDRLVPRHCARAFRGLQRFRGCGLCTVLHITGSWGNYTGTAPNRCSCYLFSTDNITMPKILKIDRKKIENPSSQIDKNNSINLCAKARNFEGVFCVHVSNAAARECVVRTHTGLTGVRLQMSKKQMRTLWLLLATSGLQEHLRWPQGQAK